jgi:hypothetical protein
MGKAIIVAIAFVAVVGCGRPQMGTVAGRITKDGKPVANAALTFVTPGHPTSVGTTDASGRFTLSTRRLNDGAYAGQHAVVIRRDPPTGDPYEDPLKTPLRADVIAGRHNVVDLVLDR